MNSPTANVAVIDLGSNSFKALIATRENGLIVPLDQETIDARISTGISEAEPRLRPESIERGIAAIKELQEMVDEYQPACVAAVATSAVRDAVNGGEFAERVFAATGIRLRILSGDEEARLVGRGLLTDPALAHLHDFYVFDLGGGSLEVLRFQNRQLAHATSFPLGSVRLCEKMVGTPSEPLPPAEDRAVRQHTRQLLRDAGHTFEDGTKDAVFAGGSMTTSRMMLGEERGQTMGQTPAFIPLPALDALHRKLAHLHLEDRLLIPGLPERRADIMPTSLSTILAIAELGGFDGFHHSLCSLRWGLADELLCSLA